MKPTPLQVLARLHGIQTGYRDAFGQWQTAIPEALRRVLELLGVEPAALEKPRRAIGESVAAWWRRPVDPVRVLWDDAPPTLDVRLPASEAQGAWTAFIEFETGGATDFSGHFETLEAVKGSELSGQRYVAIRLPLPASVPWGYHRLVLAWGGNEAEVLLMKAPVRAEGLPNPKEEGRMGAFLPLYALRTEKDWGAGDFSDLGALTQWAGGRDFQAVGTLPLLPAFLEEPFNPSPYSPVSRRFWGEHFVDPRAAPEFASCPEARERLETQSFRRTVDELRQLDKVDYAKVWSLKRPILELLARELRQKPALWRERVEPFVRDFPDVLTYARFRAAQEKYRGTNWREWPAPHNGGALEEAGLDTAVVDFYLYAQLLAHEQISAASGNSGDAHAPLYLDLPLGAHPDGFDHWREPEAFVEGCSVGAPPDPLFTGGQDWGFAPMHPRRIRERGYRYFIACLRHHLAHARILRIDHVLGFHRLFWVPWGTEARDGVYVRYQPEEFYAILAIESQRYGAAIVGEDLGTVPKQVRASMDRHGISRTYAMEIELRDDPDHALGDIPEGSVACVNTHDIPPFAGFWAAEDIEQQASLGLLDEEGRRLELERRAAVKRSLLEFLKARMGVPPDPDSPVEIVEACLRIMRESGAALTLVNLEDLWGEHRRQNLPGSTHEYPNWRHRARYALEEIKTVADIERLFRGIGLSRTSSEG